jgi:hypothetical protein
MRQNMKVFLNSRVCATALAMTVFMVPSAQATGLATCDSGDASKWQRPSVLEKKLTAMQWKVSRIKIDGGCYEVYALNEKGQRIEAYFHPLTLESVPTKAIAQ